MIRLCYCFDLVARHAYLTTCCSASNWPPFLLHIISYNTPMYCNTLVIILPRWAVSGELSWVVSIDLSPQLQYHTSIGGYWERVGTWCQWVPWCLAYTATQWSEIVKAWPNETSNITICFLLKKNHHIYWFVLIVLHQVQFNKARNKNWLLRRKNSSENTRFNFCLPTVTT